MAEKNFRAVLKKVEAMGLRGQERLEALKVELDKAEDEKTVDWSWTVDQIERFIKIMEDLYVIERGKGMVYLVFAVMLLNELKDETCGVEEICEMIACKYNTTYDEVISEIGHFQKAIYENMTGVRAMVDKTIQEKMETYFGGNESKIQNTAEFIKAIAKAM